MTDRKSSRRKRLSRLERDQRLRRWTIIGAAVVFGTIAFVLILGFYQQYVVRPQQPVALVDGEPIPLEAYEKRVQYRRYDYRAYLARLESQRQQLAASDDEQQEFMTQYLDQQINQVRNDLANIGMLVLDEMIDEALVRNECAQRGITVSEEEVQQELEAQFGYDRNPPTPVPVTDTEPFTETLAPTEAPMTEAQFEENATAFFRQVRGATGFAEEDFRQLLRSALLEQELRAEIEAEVPTTAEQVRARHILVETRAEGEKVLAALEDGGDFAELAQEYSIDPGSSENGGDLGWFPRDAMVEAFSEAAFSLQPGEISGLIETDYGFHIIRVEDYAAERELDESALAQRQRAAVDAWFSEQRNSDRVQRLWSASMVPTPLPTPAVR